MRRIVVPLFCIALIAGIAAPCAAELTILNIAGEKVVHDNTNDIVWIHDLGLFSNLTYPEVLDKIEDLNSDTFFGLHDWHLANPSEIGFLWWQYGPDMIEEIFLPTGPDMNGNLRWEGRYDSLYQGTGGYHCLMSTTSTGRYFGPCFGAFGDQTARPELSAWVAAVPEPSTILLIGLGAVAMRVKGRKK